MLVGNNNATGKNQLQKFSNKLCLHRNEHFGKSKCAILWRRKRTVFYFVLPIVLTVAFTADNFAEG